MRILLLALPGCLITRAEIDAKDHGSGDADADADADTDTPPPTDTAGTPAIAVPPFCPVRYGGGIPVVNGVKEDATSLVGADVNGDEKIDLAGGKEALFLYPGLGAGYFSVLTESVPRSLSSLAVGELDDKHFGDEVAVVGGGTLEIANWVGDAFSFAAPWGEDSTFDAFLVAVVDVNGDGLDDVIVVESGGLVVWSRLLGAWTPLAPGDPVAGLDQGVAIAQGDLEGDGDPDVAVLSPGGVTIGLGSGANVVTHPTTGLSGTLLGATFADIDGLPGDELVGVGLDGDLVVWRYHALNSAWTLDQTVADVEEGAFPVYVGALEFGDGCRAVAVVLPESVRLWWPDGQGALATDPTSITLPEFAGVDTFVAAATSFDADGDGDPDLVAALSTGGTAVYTWLLRPQ